MPRVWKTSRSRPDARQLRCRRDRAGDPAVPDRVSDHPGRAWHAQGDHLSPRLFFASIPHDWYRKNELAGYEGYYASVVYCYFAALGVDLIPEYVTSHGRIDLTVCHRGRVWLIEFKVNELSRPGRALAQLKDRAYAAKYAGNPVTLIGIEFSRETRNISRFEWERV